ncbi:hypothetical protein R84B8_00713 [Treponema sp. R8-4-B8]
MDDLNRLFEEVLKEGEEIDIWTTDALEEVIPLLKRAQQIVITLIENLSESGDNYDRITRSEEFKPIVKWIEEAIKKYDSPKLDD